MLSTSLYIQSNMDWLGGEVLQYDKLEQKWNMKQKYSIIQCEIKSKHANIY